MKPETQAFLDQLSRSTDTVQAAVADNCRFDERVSLERWQQFETYLPTPNPEYPDWSEANGLHYEKHVTVISSSIPDSFLDLNQTAWLAGIVTNREVVRLEHLGYALEKSNLRFEQLKKLPDRQERFNRIYKDME